MKTRMNINQIAKLGFASIAIALLSSFAPVQAGNDEEKAALARLENMNISIEESIKFKVPVVAEDIEAYEVQAANERLENMNLAIEQSIKFRVPAKVDSEISKRNTGNSPDGSPEYVSKWK
jgi:hypothetical protein